MLEHFPCDTCTTLTPIELLDAKPNGWYWSLARAADRGVDFDRLECRACYGPDWQSMTHAPTPANPLVRALVRPFVALAAADRRLRFRVWRWQDGRA